MTWLLGTAGNRIAAVWHGLAGRICFRLGRIGRARRHFERVLDLRGEQFSAYVYLGRIAYGIGDYAGWRREFGHARRLDPDRFARLRHPFDLFEPRAAGTLFDEAGERATWRAVRLPASRGQGQRSPARSVDPGPEWAAGSWQSEWALEPGLQCGDDFSSDQERSRFATRPPITSEEVRAADLDELCRRLAE